MTSVAVVDAGAVPPRPGAHPALAVRPTLGPGTGFDLLHQAVLECPPGATCGPIDVGAVEETLYVLEGEGTIEVKGVSHPLGADVGIYLPPGTEFTLHAHGPGPVRVVAVRIIDPSPGPPSPPKVVRLADQSPQPATADREFQIVANPDTGLRSATHFVGYIPTQRAPEHFHTYDEVIYVLEGEGVMHAEGRSVPVAPGSCIQLPARTVHCLENTGAGTMRIVAVFRPAGSPASAFYPDGTPAYSTTHTATEEQ